MALFKKTKKDEKVESKEKTTEKKVADLPEDKDPKLYEVIKKPIVTEKAVNSSGSGKYVFMVSKKANKTEVGKAIERLYDVKVRAVNISNVTGKKRQLGRFEGWKPGFKKAVVALEKGFSIDIHT
ncbi:MAG: 50S ribosomal protein L23 [Patescibacteria group bacterium]